MGIGVGPVEILDLDAHFFGGILGATLERWFLPVEV